MALMTFEEAKSFLATSNPLVRIDPNNTTKKRNAGGHWMRGKLIGIYIKHFAIVQPFGHRRVEKIEYKFLKIWKGKQ